LVEATDNFARSLGVRFGVKTAVNNVPPRESNRAISGSIEDTTALIPGGIVTPSTSGLNVNLASPGVGGRAAASLGLTIAKLGTNGDLLNLELSALEQEGRGKIISSPRVITANQKKAKIEQGQELNFQVPGSGLAPASLVTKRATLKLEVTPQITPDDRVNLDVIVTKDSIANAQQGTLNIKEVQTQVLLDNGETVVIGGIYEQTLNDTVNKVPVLGDIPLLGWLFKNKESLDTKTELLIFLTPRIVSENLTLR
jgi:type IV pilus assembly protein PilQ